MNYLCSGRTDMHSFQIGSLLLSRHFPGRGRLHVWHCIKSQIQEYTQSLGTHASIAITCALRTELQFGVVSCRVIALCLCFAAGDTRNLIPSAWNAMTFLAGFAGTVAWILVGSAGNAFQSECSGETTKRFHWK